MLIHEKQMLKDRALILAKENNAEEVCEHLCSTMLRIQLSSSVYGIDASFVKEIIYTNAVIPIPGVTNFIRGIINVRGKITAIVDLALLLGIKSDTNNCCHVVVLKDAETGMEFGIIVDDILQTVSVKHEDIKVLPTNVAGTILSGITSEGLIIIDSKEMINGIIIK